MSGQGLPVFGRYEALARVGEGSLGTVYRARHVELGRDAAIKELRAEVRAVSQAADALRSEASVLAGLDHPNIVAFYDFVEEPDRAWLAEQWIDGAPLDALLTQHGRLSAEQALGVLTGALTGLAYAHGNGVVHRDIAASNILADSAGTSMLVDFGLAAPVEGLGASGNAGVVGTPAYLSPEAARGQPVGRSGDVYSAAALAFHLLTGRPVFGGSAWEMVAAHRDQSPPALTGHGPRLEDLLRRSLAKDPAQRPVDAAAFLSELEEAATERYGAGWRSRSSIAGLVAATAAAGTTAIAAGGAAPPTVVATDLPSTVTGLTTATLNTGSRTGLKIFLAAGATLVVVAAAATAWAISDDNDGNNGTASETPTLSAEEKEEKRQQQREAKQQEQQQELEATVPTGRYDARWTTVTTLRDGSTEEGDPYESTVLIEADCNASACRGSLTELGSDGKPLPLVWNGTSVTLGERSVSKAPKAACVDNATGETLPIGESAAIITTTTTYKSSSGSPPDRFVIEVVYKYTYEFFGTCEPGADDDVRTVGRWVLTRKR